MPPYIQPASHQLRSIFCLCLAVTCLLYCFTKIKKDLTDIPPDPVIFLEHCNTFLESGQLYSRPAADETLAFVYRPADSSYKFPPAFILPLLPFCQNSIHAIKRNIMGVDIIRADAFTSLKIIAVSVYLLSAILIFHAVNPVLKCTHQRRIIALIFFGFLTSADSLFKQIHYMNVEIFILFFLSITAVLLKKNTTLQLIFISILAAVKIYPAILIAYSAIRLEWKAFIFGILGILLLIAIGIGVIGTDENIFYFSEILPLLLREPVLVADFNISLDNLLTRISDNTNLISMILKSVLLASSLYLIHRHRNQPTRQLHSFALLITCMLTLLKNVWSAYLLAASLPLLLCIADAVSRPTRFKAIMLAILFILLAVDLDWHLEINYLKEMRQLTSSAQEEYWASQPAEEVLAKKYLFTFTWLSPLILWTFRFKAMVTLVLWVWVACILEWPPPRYDSDNYEGNT